MDTIQPTIISRKEAMALGLRRYFTGKPCKNGHVSERRMPGTCIECFELFHRLNPHKTKEYNSKQYNKPDGREKRRLWSLSWRKRNRLKHNQRTKKWSDDNREKQNAAITRWTLAHPEATRAKYARRRSRRKGAEGNYTADDIKAMMKEQAGKCAAPHCCADIRHSYEIDHKQPLSRGGSNWPSNLQLLCKPCNKQKSFKTNDEWLCEAVVERPW
jgi:5-methylcytosine-specific restriction endonuclease McrA